MAEQIKLVQTNDMLGDALGELSLLPSASNYVWLERDGWVPKYGEGDLVTEVLTLRARGTSRDNLAANVALLEQKLQQVRDFIAHTPERLYVVLRDQLDGETNARQAPLAGVSVEIRQPLHHCSGNHISSLVIGLDRVPWWEATTSTLVQYTNISVMGGYASVTAAPGTLPARIAQTRILPVNGSGGLGEFWCGFRTNRYGGLTNFVARWEAELASVLDTGVTLAADATATPGGAGNTKLAISFAGGATFAHRFTLRAYDISSTNYGDLRGTFEILGRMRTSAAGTSCVVGVENNLYGSYPPPSVTALGNLATVSGTGWSYYPLGRITWPAMDRMTSAYADDVMLRSGLRLYASRTTGAGDLEVDHFVALPVEDGYMHCVPSALSYAAAEANRVELYVSPLGDVAAFQYLSALIECRTDVQGTTLDTWHFPLDSGRLYVAAQCSAITDTVSLDLRRIPRYKLMRGAT